MMLGYQKDGETTVVRHRPAFDARLPTSARIWNYWAGGKDNFAADRQAGHDVGAAMPALPAIARANRRFLVQTVRTLSADHGIRQFLDIGVGLPGADNTHDVAQRAAPASRIVYVDHDPVVLSHARALLISTPEGQAGYVHADLRDPAAILAGAAQTLDFTRPVAILLLAVLHFLPDAARPHEVVAALTSAVPPGSYLAIAHCASDIAPAQAAEAARRYGQHTAQTLTPRTRKQVLEFFTGLTLASAGLAAPGRWRQGPASANYRLPCYYGLARKNGE